MPSQAGSSLICRGYVLEVPYGSPSFEPAAAADGSNELALGLTAVDATRALREPFAGAHSFCAPTQRPTPELHQRRPRGLPSAIRLSLLSRLGGRLDPARIKEFRLYRAAELRAIRERRDEPSVGHVGFHGR